MKKPPVGLNRITLPHYPLKEFLNFAEHNGFAGVELRNDMPGRSILDAYEPGDVRQMSRDLGLEVISINALQRFNDVQERLDERAEQLGFLVKTALPLGCLAIVLCPVNDVSDPRSETQRQEDTIQALHAFGPLLEESGIKGWIEPLGFPQCSLRFKEDAVNAIDQCGFADIYGIVHDTFHHYLSAETKMFPEHTSLVHVSGVEGDKKTSDILDDDRVLVTADDLLGNRSQVRDLLRGNFKGYFSFECFSTAFDPSEIAVSRNFLFPPSDGGTGGGT